MENMFLGLTVSDWQGLGWVAAGCYVVIVLIMAKTGAAIVWDDFPDLGATFGIPLAAGLAIMTFIGADELAPWDSTQLNALTETGLNIVAIGLSGLTGLFIIREYVQVQKLNGSVLLTIFIGTFRVLFSCAAIFMLASALSGKDAKGGSGAANALVVLALIGMIFLATVNGDKVRAARARHA